MTFSDEIAGAVDELRTELGSPELVIDGHTVPCVVSTIRRGNVVAVGGFEETIGCTFIVTVSDWETTGLASGKATGSVATYDGQRYRLLTVRRVPGGSHYEIDAIDPKR